MISVNAFNPVRFASLQSRKAAVDKQDAQTQLQTAVSQPAVQAFRTQIILPGFSGQPAVSGRELLKEITALTNGTETDPDSDNYGCHFHRFEDLVKANFGRKEIPLVEQAVKQMTSLGLAEAVNGSICSYPEPEYANQFVVAYKLTDLGRLAIQ